MVMVIITFLLVSVIEQLTTDPAGFITVTNLCLTLDTEEEDISPRQEKIRLIEGSADDDGMTK